MFIYFTICIINITPHILYFVIELYIRAYKLQEMQGLNSIPSSSYYRLNTNTIQNPQDSRVINGPEKFPATVTLSGGGTKGRKQSRHKRGRGRKRFRYNKSKKSGGKSFSSRSKSKSKSKSKYSSKSKNSALHLGYINYAGKQIGHQTRSHARNHRQKQHHSMSQSGGTMMLPSDLNMLASSAESLLGNSVATLRGTDYNSNPIPFGDKVHVRNL